MVLDPKKKLVEYVQNDEMRALFKRILEHIEKMKKKSRLISFLQKMRKILKCG